MTTPLKIITKEEYLKANKKPNQEKIWDNIAKPWKRYVVKKIKSVENFLKNKKGKVIDLGCGTGRNMIENDKITYYGVDFSEGQLEQAKRHIKENHIKAKLIKSKANNLKEIKDNTFDYGLFIAALHCIETKDKRKKSLEEFFRVLKPNSRALISVWNSDDKRFAKVNFHGDIYMSWYEQGIPYMRYYYLYEKEELLDLLKSVGFKIVNFHEEEYDDRFSKKNWIIEVQK
tara:strand:- start:405 stop:1094 length:690 start_codon:yes stop_codon:yes gene_type:complete